MFVQPVLAFVASALLLAGTAGAAHAAPTADQSCRAAKLSASSKASAALIKCSERAARDGGATPTVCVDEAAAALVEAFEKADTKAGAPCGFDAAAASSILTAMLDDIESVLPAPAEGGKCPSSQRKAAGKLASSELKARAKSVKTADSGKLADALEKAASKFASAMVKADGLGDCAVTGQAAGASAAVSTGVGELTGCFVDGICTSPITDSIAPTAGSLLGGTTVTIHGSNFTGATGVRFGGTPATSFAVVSPTTIEAVTAGGTPGPAAVAVENAVGTASGLSFSYDCSGFTLTPAGDVIETTPGATVAFDILPHTNPPGITLEYDWDCDDEVATGSAACAELAAASGPAVDVGVVDAMRIHVQPSIRVLPAGTVCSPFDEVTVTSLGSPVVSSIAPTAGTLFGGTTVTIVGSNFAGVSDVSFGGTPATSFTVVSPTKIEAVTPGGTIAAMTVAVDNIEGTGTGPAFTYDCSEFERIPYDDYASDFAGATITIDHLPHKSPPPGVTFEWYWECVPLTEGGAACDQMNATVGPTASVFIEPGMQIQFISILGVFPGSWETSACDFGSFEVTALEADPGH